MIQNLSIAKFVWYSLKYPVNKHLIIGYGWKVPHWIMSNCVLSVS